MRLILETLRNVWKWCLLRINELRWAWMLSPTPFYLFHSQFSGRVISTYRSPFEFVYMIENWLHPFSQFSRPPVLTRQQFCESDPVCSFGEHPLSNVSWSIDTRYSRTLTQPVNSFTVSSCNPIDRQLEGRRQWYLKMVKIPTNTMRCSLSRIHSSWEFPQAMLRTANYTKRANGRPSFRLVSDNLTAANFGLRNSLRNQKAFTITWLPPSTFWLIWGNTPIYAHNTLSTIPFVLLASQ